MKILYISVLLILSCGYLQAQTNAELVSWQNDHPDVIFIEVSDFQRIKESGIVLTGKMIVYSGDISTADITSYEEEAKMLPPESNLNIHTERFEEANFIKLWLAQHGDLKILERSYFDQLNETQQTMYLENDALILTGELLTVKDITDYESAH